MRTSAATEPAKKRVQVAKRAGKCLGDLTGRGERHTGCSLPFTSLNLKSLVSEDSESEPNAEDLKAGASEGVTGAHFHTVQRRRGSAESDSGTTTLETVVTVPEPPSRPAPEPVTGPYLPAEARPTLPPMLDQGQSLMNFSPQSASQDPPIRRLKTMPRPLRRCMRLRRPTVLHRQW